MSLGGRPKEEGGHEGINVSLNAETHRGLKKIQERGEARSKFIENALGPLIRQLDPGESCKALRRIDCLLKCEIASAVSKQDFEKTSALSAIGNVLEPFRTLCQRSDEDSIDHAKFAAKTCSCNIHLPKSSNKTRQLYNCKVPGARAPKRQ